MATFGADLAAIQRPHLEPESIWKLLPRQRTACCDPRTMSCMQIAGKQPFHCIFCFPNTSDTKKKKGNKEPVQTTSSACGPQRWGVMEKRSQSIATNRNSDSFGSDCPPHVPSLARHTCSILHNSQLCLVAHVLEIPVGQVRRCSWSGDIKMGIHSAINTLRCLLAHRLIFIFMSALI